MTRDPISSVTPGSPPDVSVVVVTFDSDAYLPGLLESLAEQVFPIDGRLGRLEVIVVDNASRRTDRTDLETRCKAPIRLIRNTENVGYALANQQGLTVARGRYHVVSNPDVRVLPGCLAALIDALERQTDAAIVGPLACLDLEASIFMPPIEVIDPYMETLNGLARANPAIARLRARQRSRSAQAYWTAKQPLAVPMLSGCFFLGRRLDFEREFFDPGYPLYYEDMDLFLRYHRAGRCLYHVPDAHIVHYWSRSANTRLKASMFRNQLSARRYFRRFHGEAGLRAWSKIRARTADGSRDQECPHPFEALEPTCSAPTFAIPAVPGVQFEVSVSSKFFFSLGMFPEPGRPFRLPDSIWDDLPTVIPLWCRTVDPVRGEPIAVWKVRKTSP